MSQMCRKLAATEKNHSVYISNNVFSSFLKLHNDIDMSLICSGKAFWAAGGGIVETRSVSVVSSSSLLADAERTQTKNSRRVR